MATIQDLVAECDGDAEKVRQAQSRIIVAKQTAEALIGELSSMDMGGSGTVNHLREVVRHLDEAMAQTSSMLESVDKAREIAASAEYGLTGQSGDSSGGSPDPSVASQGRQQDEQAPSGEELLGMSDNVRGVQGFLRTLAKSDDVTDATESLGESISSLTQFSHPDLDPPPTHTNTSAEVPSYGHPVIQSDRPAVEGSAPVAALVLTLVGIKGGQKVRQAWHRVSHWRKRESR
jgi:hypothetical protein